MAEGKREIHAGRDYFEHVTGTVTTGPSIHGDHARQQINAQQYADTITPESSKEEVQKLLQLIREEIANTRLPDDIKEEVVAPVPRVRFHDHLKRPRQFNVPDAGSALPQSRHPRDRP